MSVDDAPEAFTEFETIVEPEQTGVSDSPVETVTEPSPLLEHETDPVAQTESAVAEATLDSEVLASESEPAMSEAEEEASLGEEWATDLTCAQRDAVDQLVAEDSPAQEAPTLSVQSLTRAETPSSNVSEAWSVATKPSSDPSAGGQTTAVSEPLVVDGQLVVFCGTDILVLSPATGEVMTRLKDALPVAIASSCSPLLHEDVIHVPLCDGSVVALNVADSSKPSFLTKLWTSEALTDGDAAACSLGMTTHSGKTYLLVGLSAGVADATAGVFATLDATTGRQVSSFQSATAGYGEAAPFSQGGIVYVGDSSGMLRAISLNTGEDVSSLSLSTSAICGKVIACGDALLVVDRAGTLHKVSVGSDGSLANAGSVSIGNGCASAPVVVGRVAFCGVCGPSGKEASEGALVMVDVRHMRITQKVASADGVPFDRGGVTAEPLVSVGVRGTWCHFALNGPTGAVYSYRLGDAQARELFVLAGKGADGCDLPLVADADGSIYHLNASGLLTKLVAIPAHIPHVPVTPSENRPVPPVDWNAAKPGGGTSQWHVDEAWQPAEERSQEEYPNAVVRASEAEQGAAARDHNQTVAPGGSGDPHGEGSSAEGLKDDSQRGSDSIAPFVVGGNASIGEIMQVDAQDVAAVSQNSTRMNVIKTLAVISLGFVTYLTLRHPDKRQR